MVKCLGADDHPAMPFFSLFVILWSVLFVSAWEQKSNDYSWEWGVYGEEKKERVRPEFKVRTTAQLHSSSCSSPSSSFSCCCCASHCLLLLHPPPPTHGGHGASWHGCAPFVVRRASVATPPTAVRSVSTRTGNAAAGTLSRSQ